jgi:cytochrome c biogenesis protein CcdA
MYIVVCYVTYLAISLAVTIWVARTLHHNGRTFLMDAFQGNQELADSVNHLLVVVVGFYLINIGYVALAMRTGDSVPTVRSAIELVCDKLGVVLIVLGIMHFLNLYVFNRLRKRGLADLRPPIPPDARISIQPES